MDTNSVSVYNSCLKTYVKGLWPVPCTTGI